MTEPSDKILAALRESIREDCARSDDESEARAALAETFSVEPSLCQGRRFGEPEKRFKPIVYETKQCDRKPAEGDDLCSACRKNLENFALTDKVRWHGRVSEPLPDHSHALGGAWEKTAKLKWIGE